MAGAADASFEELFVRIVPVEVCCIHSSSSNGGAKPHSPQKGSSQCLRMQAPSGFRHGTNHFSDGMMPGTPTAGGMQGSGLNPTAVGLYPTLSSTELGACFCPNCCSNSYTERAGEGCADASPLATVAVQRLTVRVLGQKTRYGANGRLLPGCYRMELSSDSSLFFLFTSTITEAAFGEIKESCDLSLGFQQLPGLLLQLLDLLVRQPSTYLARLMMQSDGSGAMEFAQTLGFKTLSLLVLPCLEPAPAAVVRGYVTARHNAVLERCAGIEAELADLKALVRQRCPNLLLQANKHSHQHLNSRPESALA